VRRPYAIHVITRHGLAIGARLAARLPDADLFVSKKFQTPPGAQPFALPMGPHLEATFAAYDCHIFVISIGAVVRMIAPLLVDKKVDPAVVCVDDDARYAICTLSGHVGRGNDFTHRVAAALGATPIVTTASDVRNTLTVDILGRDLGWTLDDPDRNVTRGCAAVVNAAPVAFVQESGEPSFWPEDKPLPEGVRYATSLDAVDPSRFEILLVATDRELAATHPAHWANAVIYRPRSLVVGIGCDRGAPPDMVERGLHAVLAEHKLSPRSIRKLATVDKKADEPALLDLCDRFGWPLHVFPAATLDAVSGIETPSEIVKKHVGTRGVAEPAALAGAGAIRLLVPKQIYTEPGVGRSMTIAIARLPFAPRTEAAHV
jgi:cobalt-precorrin 5A hydrolase